MNEVNPSISECRCRPQPYFRHGIHVRNARPWCEAVLQKRYPLLACHLSAGPARCFPLIGRCYLAGPTRRGSSLTLGPRIFWRWKFLHCSLDSFTLYLSSELPRHYFLHSPIRLHRISARGTLHCLILDISSLFEAI